MEFKKAYQGEGECYGVVYNPRDHSVTVGYRNAENTVFDFKDMTEKQRLVAKLFAAEFLALDQNKSADTIELAIDTDMTATLTAMHEVVKEIEK